MPSLDKILAIGFVVLLPACNTSGPSGAEAGETGTTQATGTESGGESGTGTTDATTDTSTTDTSTTTTDTSGDEITDLVITENPNNVLSFYVDWNTATQGPSELDLTCDSGYAPQYLGQSDETQHRVFVMGLVPGDACTVTAHSAGASASLDYNVGSPSATIPDLDIITIDESLMQPGWTLTNLGDAGTIPAQLAIYDSQGRPRWYQQMDTTATVGVVDTRLFDGGILQAGAGNSIHPTLFDWEGNVLWSETFSMHHTLVPDRDDPNLLYYLFDTADCPVNFNGIASTEVRRWDRDMGTYTWSWRLCEHYTPAVVQADWSHGNAIEQFPGEDTFLLSLRQQHRLIKFSGTTGDIEWTMGMGGDFTMADSDLFYRQHAPEIQDNGNILLFDNGDNVLRPSSRAIELAYDTNTMIAEVVWEFDPDPVIFTNVYGDTDRQDNGNVLVAFGNTNASAMSNFFEVLPDGTIAWQANSPVGRKWYRAERIDENSGYVVQ